MGPGGFEPSGSTGTKTAGISPLIILALVGAGAAMFLSKKK
jgi:LPXTG-motif cell wall-anchored protein